MALESFSGIWGLNVNNPATSDDVSQGDDHIRGIKASLLLTFPSISATVNVSQNELNALSGISSNVQGQLDLLSSNFANSIAYGSMYLNNSSTEFSASTSFSLVTSLNTPGDVGTGTTVKTASGAIAVTRAGHYTVATNYSISASTAAEITVALYVNDTDTGLHGSTLVPAQGRANVGAIGDVSLGASDEIRVRLKATVAKLITIKDGQLRLRKLN